MRDASYTKKAAETNSENDQPTMPNGFIPIQVFKSAWQVLQGISHSNTWVFWNLTSKGVMVAVKVWKGPDVCSKPTTFAAKLSLACHLGSISSFLYLRTKPSIESNKQTTTLWENVRKTIQINKQTMKKKTKQNIHVPLHLFQFVPPRLCWTSNGSTGGVSTGGWSDRKRRSATCICCHRSSTSCGGLVAELCHHHHHHHHHHLGVSPTQ